MSLALYALALMFVVIGCVMDNGTVIAGILIGLGVCIAYFAGYIEGRYHE